MKITSLNRFVDCGLQIMLVLVALLSTTLNAWADRVEVAANARSEGIESQNDAIIIGRGAIINGDLQGHNDYIKVDEGARITGSIKNRNGAIQVADNVQVEGSIESDNGAIQLDDAIIARALSSLNGAIKTGRQGKFGYLTNRNGSIVLGEQSEAREVINRNGGIRVRSGSITGSVSNRNGRIAIDADVRISGSVSNRNGDIVIANANISEDVNNRNGRIEIEDASIGGSIQSFKGIVYTKGSTEVSGDVVIDLSSVKSSGWLVSRGKTRLEIVLGDETQVLGSVILKLPASGRSRYEALVVLGPNASVAGEVRVSEGVETRLSGQVMGGSIILE